MDVLAVSAGTQSPGLFPKLDSLVLTDAVHVHEILLGLASVAVVVWTAGFLVRALGHKPNRGLVAGMTYAQLAFMGAFAAAIFTPLALQAVALMFLLLELWQTPSIVYYWRRSPEQRTFFQQQILDLYGLTSATDVVWYVVLQLPYDAAIVAILVWPSQFVALPLIWIALYGSYQILTSFLYFKPAEEQPKATNVRPSALPAPLSSLRISADTQRNIMAFVDNTAVTKTVFLGREQNRAEAVVALRILDEASLALGQFAVVSQTAQLPAVLFASGYVHAMSRHRAALARLYASVIGVPYQPRVAVNLLDETIRALAFYDLTASPGTAQIGQFVQHGNEISVVIKDANFDTTTRSCSLSWLGEVYLEESNGALLHVYNYLVNWQPSGGQP